MIIWRGWGILVIVIAAVCQALAQLIAESVNADPEQSMTGKILSLVGFLVAAALIWWLGKFLNQKSESKVYVDKETGQEVRMGPQHTLFFIRMEYWAFILAVVGVIAVFAGW